MSTSKRAGGAFLLAAALLASCGGDGGPCDVDAGCDWGPAVAVAVHAPGGGPVTGAFVDVTRDGQTARLDCRPSTEGSLCNVGGGAGARHLEIGAPGYVTVERDVVVEREGSGCCADAPVTKVLAVPLKPASGS